MRNSTEDDGEKSVYEIGFLVLPSIPEDKVSDVTDAIRKVVTKEDGKEIDAEEPFMEQLAYPMSKTVGASRYVVEEAYIGWIKFDLPADPVAGVEHPIETIKKGIEKIDEVLRFLLVKAPRETIFTFAKARLVVEKKEELALPSPTEEVVVI